MVTLDEVARWCLDLPGVTTTEKYGNRTWAVGRKSVAWERPLTKADVKRWDVATDGPVPTGDIVAIPTEDMHHKAAVLADAPKGFFDMQHFAGYPAVLVGLRLAGKRAVRAAIEDAWLAAAPARLAEEYLATKRGRRATPR